jgi:hypothetical protein
MYEINWPDLVLPPINLWNAPVLQNKAGSTVSPQVQCAPFRDTADLRKSTIDTRIAVIKMRMFAR